MRCFLFNVTTQVDSLRLQKILIPLLQQCIELAI